MMVSFEMNFTNSSNLEGFMRHYKLDTTLVIFLKGNLKKHFKIKGTKLLTEKNSLGKVSF